MAVKQYESYDLVLLRFIVHAAFALVCYTLLW